MRETSDKKEMHRFEEYSGNRLQALSEQKKKCTYYDVAYKASNVHRAVYHKQPILFLPMQQSHCLKYDYVTHVDIMHIRLVM